ncbi:MAG: hypothetical protein R3C11_23800 [Planctomycetaceae bacterium]
MLLKFEKWDLAVNAEMGPVDSSWDFLEEIRLRLLLRALEIIKQIDNQLEISLRISDPWGQYHGAGGYLLTPFQFVDMLTRSRGNVTSLKLVFTDAYQDGKTPAMDWLELSRLIDYWAALGIPLKVILAAPSSGDSIPHARYQVDADQAHLTSPQTQLEWYQKAISLMCAKESVTGIQFEHLDDRFSHLYASAGFIDQLGMTKTSLEQIARYRTFDWKP